MNMISNNMSAQSGETRPPVPTVPVSDVKTGGSNIETMTDPYKRDDDDKGETRDKK